MSKATEPNAPEIKVVCGYAHTRVESQVPSHRDVAYRVLDPLMRYMVPGAEYSQKFKDKVWDGRMHLLRRQPPNKLVFPAGFTDDAIQLLSTAGFRPLVVRPSYDRCPVDHGQWAGYDLRDYQRQAVDSLLRAPRGVLRLPIRSGKTMIAARAIMELGTRTVFVAPSISLLEQAYEAFCRFLPGTKVGRRGDGYTEDAGADIVVITQQSFAMMLRDSRDKHGNDPPPDAAVNPFFAFCQGFGAMFVDEAHHCAGDGALWRESAVKAWIPRKYGLSATLAMGTRATDEPGAELWLQGACGDVVFEVPMSALVDRGVIMRVCVRFVPSRGTELESSAAGPSLVKVGIVENEGRNRTIVETAVDFARRGYKVLVDAAQVAHVNRLALEIRRVLGPKVAAVVGSTKREDRLALVRRFESGQLSVLVSNVLGEGVDLPGLEVVINAEGGVGDAAVIQRIRNATYHPTKKPPVLVDFLDEHHKKLSDNARNRYKIYRRENCFDFDIRKVDDDAAGP